MNVENHFKFKIEEPRCQKCGCLIKEGEGNICLRCLIEISNGSLKKEDFYGTKKAKQPHKTRKGQPISKKEVIG